MTEAGMDTPDTGASDAQSCPHCQASIGPDRDACSACGRFQPQNQAAVKAGIYSVQKGAAVRECADSLTRGIVSDLGGETELSTLQLSYVHKLADLEVVIRLLSADIVRRGLLTPAGAVRNTHPQLLATLTLFDRYASRLGLGRRAKSVMTLDQYIVQKAAEKARQAEASASATLPASEPPAASTEPADDGGGA